MMLLGQYRAVLGGTGLLWCSTGLVLGGTVWYLVVMGQYRVVMIDI